MYVPYLYARRSELLAVYATSLDRGGDDFLPVLEPVLSSIAGPALAIKRLKAIERRVGIVWNARKHELSSPTALREWRKAIQPSIDEHPGVVPVILADSQTSTHDINQILAHFQGRSAVLALDSSALSAQDVKSFADLPQVELVAVLAGRASSAQRQAIPRKKLVLINDGFNKLPRNADYGPPEFFTDDHTLVPQHVVGIGDFACVGSTFTVGGGTPHAIAIHAAYKHSQSGAVWVEHFVSDNKVKGDAEVSEKFLQAARKLVKAATARPTEFGSNLALDEFRMYVKQKKYPGLGKSKELQVTHHCCLMLDVLRKVL